MAEPGRTYGADSDVRTYAVSMASLFEPFRKEKEKDRVHCLACGKPVEAALSHLGSLRCVDCRDAHAVLNPKLLRRDGGFEMRDL
jgi:hypothetical protein